MNRNRAKAPASRTPPRTSSRRGAHVRTPRRGPTGDPADDAGAVKRTRRGSQRRLVRTIVLGTVAVVAAIAWMASEFGMDARELGGYALTSVAMVAAAVVLGLAGAGLLRLIRKLTRR